MAGPFQKDEKVLVWSNSKEAWFPGSVIDVLCEERLINGSLLKPGSLQVSSGAGTKWVYEPDVTTILHRRYEVGEKVEYLSSSKEWIADAVVQRFLDEDTEVEGKARLAGSVHVRAGRSTKWIGPSDAHTMCRRSPMPVPAKGPRGTSPSAPASWDTVWAFWDIENFKPEELEVQAAADALQKFLESKGYGGVGVTLTLAAFYPQHLAAKEGFGANFVKQLERASVLQILCTNKRESADRKLEQVFELVSRLDKDKDRTAYIFITSDGDFQNILKRAKERALHAVILHNCERGSSTEKSMEQHVARSFRWQEVEALHGRSLRKPPAWWVARSSHGRSTSARRPVSLPPERSVEVSDKVLGKVLHWNAEKGYGFLTPDGAGSDDEENVFCHIRGVRGSPPSLRAGQRVRFSQQFRPGEKGPQAFDVEVLP